MNCRSTQPLIIPLNFPDAPDVADSPFDLQSRVRWEAYTKAKEVMLKRTHIPEAPWWVVEADDKKRARLNCIAHLLAQIPYGDSPHPSLTLPARVHNPEYHRDPIPQEMYVPAVY